jgi:hypothetical protein
MTTEGAASGEGGLRVHDTMYVHPHYSHSVLRGGLLRIYRPRCRPDMKMSWSNVCGCVLVAAVWPSQGNGSVCLLPAYPLGY